MSKRWGHADSERPRGSVRLWLWHGTHLAVAGVLGTRWTQLLCLWPRIQLQGAKGMIASGHPSSGNAPRLCQGT